LKLSFSARAKFHTAPVIDLEAAAGQFGDQSAQGELPLAQPLPQPNLVLTANRPWLMPTHLARCEVAGLPKTPHPGDRRAHPDAKPQGRRVPRQTTLFNRSNHPLPQIYRTWLRHSADPLPSQHVESDFAR
jgi:hypothetical protein